MTPTLSITHPSLSWSLALAMSLVTLACTDDFEPDDHSSDTGATEIDGDDVPGDGDGDGSPGDDIHAGDGDEGDEVDPERIEAACRDSCALSDSCAGEEPTCEDQCLESFAWFPPECAPALVSLFECLAGLDCAGHDAWFDGDPFAEADYPCKDEDLALLTCAANSSTPGGVDAELSGSPGRIFRRTE